MNNNETDWSAQEIALAVADYFSILVDELTGREINKKRHRLALMPLLNNREGAFIDGMHCYISGVLVHLALPYIKGYKPRWAYAQIVEDITVEYLERNRQILEPAFTHFANDATPTTKMVLPMWLCEEVPEPRSRLKLYNPELKYNRNPIRTNYLQLEQDNPSLRRQGALLIMEYEKLWMDQIDQGLSDKIEWVSEHNYGAGFDILSKTRDGADKYIVVKTTKLGKDTPVYFTQAELEFSKEHKNNYFIYRVFHFSDVVKFYYLQGSFDQFFMIEPVQYKGIILNRHTQKFGRPF